MISQQRDAYAALKRLIIYGFIAVFISLGGLIGVGYWYINHVARQICGLIVVIDDANVSSPPPSARQQNITDAIHDYRGKLGC